MAIGCGTDSHSPGVTSNREDLEWSPGRGSWDDRLTIAGFTDTDTRLPAFASGPVVADFARDKNGDVLAVGQFSWAGRKPVAPFVRFQDGQWESARKDFDIDAAHGISAVGVGPNGEIALSVNLPPVIGRRQESRIWVDRGHGFEVVADVQGAVRTLAWAGNQLWMAGFFQMQSGLSSLAVWDGVTWSAPPGGPANGAVYDVSVDDRTGRVLVGGAFTQIGGIAAKKVAEWNGTAWTPYDMAFQSSVYALARGTEGELYAGGSIYERLERGFGGGIARWNGTAWELMGGGVFAGDDYHGVVSDLVVHQGGLYITGCLTHVRNAAGIVLTNGIARWSGSEWEPLVDDALGGGNHVWLNNERCGFEGPATLWQMRHQRLFSDGARLLLGGHSGGHGGVASQSIIAYDGKSWQAQGKANQGFAGGARRLVIGGPKRSLHAFGGVSHAAGKRLPLLSVVRRDENQWTTLTGSLTEVNGCGHIAVDRKGDVFAACVAGVEVGQPVNRLLKLTGSEWVALGDLNEKGFFSDFVADPDGRLWMVGGSVDSGFVARWDDDHFTTIERGFDQVVNRIDFAQSFAAGKEREFVVGGYFTRIGDAEISHVARFDGTSFAPLGAGLPSPVLALEYGERSIYASTDPAFPGGPALAQWNGTEWVDIGTPERGLPAPMERTNHRFQVLVEYRGKLIAAGAVWPTSGGRNVFVYDGARFTSLGGGVAGNVHAIAVAEDGLWFGGDIAEAGSGNERIPSTGIAHWKN